MRPFQKALIEYISPPVLLDVARLGRLLLANPRYNDVIRANKRWRGIYLGERVFVLANGPSLSMLDRKLLKGEKVIVMNSFDRSEWKDEVHIVAHCIGEPHSAASWSESEMVRSINGTNSESYWLHFSSRNRLSNVEESKAVHYVFPAFEPGIWGKRQFELHRPTMGYQTTAQLALQVALYMGFREIALLGFDHDWLANRDYSRHFYSATRDSSDKIGEFTYLEIISFMHRMWTIYHRIKDTADISGASISNLTPTTCLDVFRRADVRDVVR